MTARIVKTPEPPYYAVIFTNQLSDNDQGYEQMGQKMFDLASEQPGCFGAESTRDTDGIGITVSYWKDEESITAWKAQAQHLFAQKKEWNNGMSTMNCELQKSNELIPALKVAQPCK